MSHYKGVNIFETREGKYFVRVLHKSFRTMGSAKKAIDHWVNRQIKHDTKALKKRGIKIWGD